MGRTHVPKPQLKLEDQELQEILESLPIGGVAGAVKKVGRTVKNPISSLLTAAREKLFKLFEKLDTTKLDLLSEGKVLAGRLDKLQRQPIGKKLQEELQDKFKAYARNRQEFMQNARKLAQTKNELRQLDIFEATGKRTKSQIDLLFDGFFK